MFKAQALDSSAMLPACVLLTSEVPQTQAGSITEIRKHGRYTDAGRMCKYMQQYTNTCTHNHTRVHWVHKRRNCVCVFSSQQFYSSTQHSARYSSCSVSCMKIHTHASKHTHTWMSCTVYTHGHEQPHAPLLPFEKLHFQKCGS